jgi:uncharacterized protein
MRWEDFRRSGNVEDRRGGGFPGGGFRLPIGGGGLGIGGIVILGLLAYAFGIDPLLLLQGMGGDTQPAPQQEVARGPQSAPTDETGRFVAAVLAQTEDVWRRVLPEQAGVDYQDPRLVLFTGATQSACGAAQAAMGPFYCPIDRKVYIDLGFFEQMRTRLGGGGEFAYAYVIAHEVGHHVQNLLGVLQQVHERRARADRAQGNALSVQLELMADCLAGVWAANAERQWRILEPGDIERAVATAEAIGDDRLQQTARGYAVPDSFTHGSAKQRVEWLTTGLRSGRVEACNTFKGR